MCSVRERMIHCLSLIHICQFRRYLYCDQYRNSLVTVILCGNYGCITREFTVSTNLYIFIFFYSVTFNKQLTIIEELFILVPSDEVIYLINQPACHTGTRTSFVAGHSFIQWIRCHSLQTSCHSVVQLRQVVNLQNDHSNQ